MHRAFVVLGVIALAGCPSKKDSEERLLREAMNKMSEFADQICACKDKACADHVQEAMTRWSTAMAEKAGSRRAAKADEAAIKRMTEIGKQYSECLVKLMGEPESIAPPRDDVPPPGNATDADSLLRDARTWARSKQSQHLVTDAHIYYVEADGKLDAEHGRIDIVFGRTLRTADDPKRKIGAPPPPRTQPDDCFQLSWTPKELWTRTTYGCSEAYEIATRCTVKQIWQQAIARKVPAEALATISLRRSASGGSWRLAIEDEPRNISIDESFTDDCPLAVEK